ncbi:hypothetical protein [Nocardia sp. NPDC052316]|uniref:hypothetical protein n=1 Tax=Nocardia sp. NPDC052316 TaxID=3364329 RepID=UPI0037C8ABEE
MSTFNSVPNPPFLAVVLGVPAVTIMATAVLLTADRTPAPVSYQSSTRADGCAMYCDDAAPTALFVSAGPNAGGDGCVMFCEDVPKASLRDANCADAPPLINFRPWKCDPIDAPEPKGGR